MITTEKFLPLPGKINDKYSQGCNLLDRTEQSQNFTKF